ncbi:MAG: hypothetical protein WDO73_04300 [Ignavibacteriota bacterium]
MESVVLEGTALPRETVLGVAQLRVGTPVDKSAIDAVCARLGDTGLFQSVSYRYASGPKHGYILTLTIEDQKALSDAFIGFPGVDEDELWQ